MFSAEYINALAGKTGFQTASLLKQMSLILILSEIQRHPLLSKAFVVRGGTAINLFWYDLPRLSVDIDLNYLASDSLDIDLVKLRKALILFGVTSEQDWRQKDPSMVDAIDEMMVAKELNPLLRSGEEPDLKQMKTIVTGFLHGLMKYTAEERLFLDRFLDEGRFEPQLLFNDPQQAKALGSHPAVLWKLQNHRKYLGLDHG